MKKRNIYLLLMLFSAIGYSQITVDESYTTQELIEEVLFNSSCVELSNFSQSTGTDFGNENGIGAFSANGSDFPYQTGVILSSGYVANAPGPNSDTNSDGDFNWPGDTDLEANTTATQTNNASYLQFDFVPLIDQITFNFLLASEEYNQLYECTYSDAFAFILTDQISGVVQNLAVLPGTSTPIEVTNIHPEVPGLCDAINEEYFDKYNFDPFNPANDAAIDFNGQIVSLVATGPVTIGNPYTIKLVIADETDTALDSAVFIEAGSFNIGNVDLGDDILISNGNAVCEGETITLTTEETTGANYQWFKDDVELVGETTNSLNVTEEGIYRIEVTFAQSPDCIASAEVIVEFLKYPIFDLGEDQSICDNDDIILDATPTNSDDLVDVTYKWFKDNIELTGEVLSTLTVTDTGTYSVEVNASGCISNDSVIVSLASFTVDLGEDLNICDQSSIELVPTIIGEDATNATYLWSTGETSPSITISDSDTYSVEVTINGCVNFDSITVSITNLPVVDLGDDFKSCVGEEWTLNADSNEEGISYQWYLNGDEIYGATSSTLDIVITDDFSGIQNYSVTITKGACTGTDDVDVELYDVSNCVISQGISPDATPGFNDALDLEFLSDRVGGITNLQIFNRFGTIVFNKDNYVNEWYGQDKNGNELPTGTYYYVIDLASRDDVYGSQTSGWIYLNRNAN